MTHATATLDDVAQAVMNLGSKVDILGSTIDDVAESITTLGTMVSEQINSAVNGLRDELTSKFDTEIGSLRQELRSFRHEFDTFRRETDVRLSNLEGEASATRNDLREIYDRLTALEKRSINAATDKQGQLRQELDELKAWAREISAETGLPKPRF